MIVVAYLYNTNGMASWCWEAAHALAETGQVVTLVCSPDIELPQTSSVSIVRFAPPVSKTPQNKVMRELGRLSSKPSGFAYHLHLHLTGLGLKPSAYLLNQSDLLDTRVRVPQHIVAWAYPATLPGYLGKVGKFSQGKFSLNTLRILLDAAGWWRKDWQGYRQAASVLAVTSRLHAELSVAGVSSSVVHPGTAVLPAGATAKRTLPCKIVICAQDLEEPRKRIPFLLDALESLPAHLYCLTLIGCAGEEFQKATGQKSLPVTFAGSRRRAEVQELMAQSDIFLFGSCLDDWGYVLIEAMSQGLCVVAPNLSPFDEIIGEAGVLYSAYSKEDLSEKLSSLLASDLQTSREAAQTRAAALFSRQAFSVSLLKTLETKN